MDARVLVAVDDNQFMVQDRLGKSLGHDGAIPEEMLIAMSDDPPAGLAVITGSDGGQVEVLTSTRPTEPPLDDQWDDIAEVSLTAPCGVVVAPLLDGPVISLADTGGDYRLRVSCRGRDLGQANSQAGEEGFTGETYLLELWPAPLTAPTLAKQTSSFARNYLRPQVRPWVPEEAAGLAAGRLIGASLDQEGDGLSGEVDALELARIHRTRRQLMFDLVYSAGCFREYYLSGDAGEGRRIVRADLTVEEHGDRFTGERGDLRLLFHRIDRPREALIGWNWRIKQPNRHKVPFLARDSELRIWFDDGPGPDRVPTVHVRQEGLPVEWVPAMEDWWNWRLALFDVL